MDEHSDEPPSYEPSYSADLQSKSPYSRFGFDLVLPINLRNREDARVWKHFLQELITKWRRKDPYGEYFLVEENYMEWDIGLESSNPYIPFDPQHFCQFGCTEILEDGIEHSDIIHQNIWSIARKHLRDRVRRANARTSGGQTTSSERLEQLRDTVYALPPLEDDSTDGLWMWQLYEAGEVAALPPSRSDIAVRPLAPTPPLAAADTFIASEPMFRQDSGNSLAESRSMMDFPHPDMATSNLPTIVPPESHLGYTLPPDSFGLFPVIAVSPTTLEWSIQQT